MPSRERVAAFYKLNGQLEGIKRRLGTSYGILTALIDKEHSHARRLSAIYDAIKNLQDDIFREHHGV